MYAEKSKALFDEAFQWLTRLMCLLLDTRASSALPIGAFRKIRLFNPDDPTTLAEIGKIQKVVEACEEAVSLAVIQGTIDVYKANALIVQV